MSSPVRQTSSRKMAPLPGTFASSQNIRSRRSMMAREKSAEERRSCDAISSSDLREDECPESVKQYLLMHPHILEEFVDVYVEFEDLEKWYKHKKKMLRSLSSHNYMPSLHQPRSQQQYEDRHMVKLQQKLQQTVESDNPDMLPLLHELTNALGCGIKADGCTFNVVKKNSEVYTYTLDASTPASYQLRCCGQTGGSVSACVSHAVRTREAVLLKDLVTDGTMDQRFPDGPGYDCTRIKSVLVVPITLASDDIYGVMEFVRNIDGRVFNEVNLQTVTAAVTWCGFGIYNWQRNRFLQAQTELNEFLLGVSRVIFDDIVAADVLVKNIMTFAKKLVNADRCAVFLVDFAKNELYADLFDEGDGYKKKAEIRFSSDKGIAGLVARTGNIINIPDAYRDPRFNREIDVVTGYTTHNILCMPIISKGQVIGVIEMLNKKGNIPFTNADEQGFKMFSVFCALALHYSKIYREAHLRTAQYKVAIEQMSFHFCAEASEIDKFISQPFLETVPEDLESYQFYGPQDYEDSLHQLVLESLYRLLGRQVFPLHKLCRFILTVKKNYRPVSYHNWKHGFNVMHCMYCLLVRLKEKTDLFSSLRMQSLVIACLCHDVDHRGYSNAYMTNQEEPLSQLYTTSVMEQHHFAHTVTILQQEGHDIFSSLTAEDYKRMLDWIQHDILATDLALFFPIQKKISKLLLTGKFDIRDEEHFNMSIMMIMTASDLCAVCKPWQTQQKTVLDIYSEFYMQGDAEKARGQTPMPMMDRNNEANRSKDQVGFITFVCLPCYEVVNEIYPCSEPLLNGCRDNLMKWKCIVEGKPVEFWQPNKSRVDDKDAQD